jgi:hypothetical protein
MKVSAEILLSLEEKKWLEGNMRSKTTTVRLVERSKIVLLVADGLSDSKIAAELDIMPKTVSRWRGRFATGRAKAIIKDNPRGNNNGGKNTAAQLVSVSEFLGEFRRPFRSVGLKINRLSGSNHGEVKFAGKN